MKPGDIFYRNKTLRFICAHDDDNVTYIIVGLMQTSINVIPNVACYRPAFSDHVRLDT